MEFNHLSGAAQTHPSLDNDMQPQEPTLKGRLEGQLCLVEALRISRNFLESQRRLYINPQEMPANMRRDLATTKKDLSIEGRRLGGLVRSFNKRNSS